MKILDKILFAQDFASTSKNLQNVAMSLAKTFKSTIVPIHVLPEDIVNPKAKELLDTVAKEKLNETIEAFKSNGINAENPILKHGVAHDLIAMTASAVNANMILVGSGENKSKDKFKLGTTTERIIQYSEKPVLVIKEDDKFNIRTILCPVDLSDPSKRALNNAIIIARRFDANLLILSVSEEQTSSWFTSKEELNKENEERFEKHKKEFAKFLEQFNLDNLNWDKLETRGEASKEILGTIASDSVDLLIMGTAGRTGLNRLVVGSVTEKVIREVPCSFLTLKSQDVINLHLETDIKDFETLYKAGEQLEKDGFYEEAIEQYKASLGINTMHVPAYSAIAKLYDKLDKPEKAKLYRKSANEIKERIWYNKIEEEVRKLRGS
ncbi:universal stress protein [Winogradskyella alexanderae]|uniref:Universal stress protein n=1 Tax=Winogradskyella alexanderae TaxID=2877123 RepID=A0ABS7XQ97_9FLAO|nr:universal stress protein [Winogradskyella alexanderae]MCA0132192.1 universal stress protein [Winogradskyella alexanderae]